MRRALSSPRVRLALLPAVVIGGAITVAALGAPRPEALSTAVERAGIAAPAVFVLAYAVFVILLVPGSLGSAASGALFGAAVGTLLAVVGATLGATGAYLIARRIGRVPVERVAGRRARRIDAWLRGRGFIAVLYLRLLPIVPFNVLNYAAGVSAVPARDYVTATALGILPGTFAYAALGSSLDDPTSPAFTAAVGLIVVLVISGPVLARLNRRVVGPAEEPRPQRQLDTKP